MTSPAENLNLPAPERVIVPCRLIFWGIIISLPYISVNGVAGVNCCIGILLILWGVVRLSRIPIARRYQQLMWFPVIVAFCAMIIAFYGAILPPLQPTWLPPPSAIVFVLWFLCTFVSIVCMVLFCCCMQKYCTVMSWERALASWLFSAKMTSRGVLLPLMILAIPMFVCFTSLEFFPKNPPPITWTACAIEGTITEMQFIASRNEEVVHSEIVLASPDGSFSRPTIKLDPLPHEGANISYGEWFAPVKGVFAWSVMLLFVLVFLVFFCAVIHFLMSLSRTIYAAQEHTAKQEPQV